MVNYVDCCVFDKNQRVSARVIERTKYSEIFPLSNDRFVAQIRSLNSREQIENQRKIRLKIILFSLLLNYCKIKLRFMP